MKRFDIDVRGDAYIDRDYYSDGSYVDAEEAEAALAKLRVEYESALVQLRDQAGILSPAQKDREELFGALEKTVQYLDDANTAFVESGDVDEEDIENAVTFIEDKRALLARLGKK